MQTIFYRHESNAARQVAEAAGLPYPGRERLNMMHVGISARDRIRAVEIIAAIKDESDYFRGRIETQVVQLESKGV